MPCKRMDGILRMRIECKNECSCIVACTVAVRRSFVRCKLIFVLLHLQDKLLHNKFWSASNRICSYIKFFMYIYFATCIFAHIYLLCDSHDQRKKNNANMRICANQMYQDWTSEFLVMLIYKSVFCIKTYVYYIND